ncbi:MAG TPA: hypothetical protein VKS99_13195 [Blastocatellia bacterium]|nr:hypothetical protein [Blastocatellia bacterium]
MSKQNGRPKVVIVGGGFGRLYAAKGLPNRPVSVALVDRKNTWRGRSISMKRRRPSKRRSNPPALSRSGNVVRRSLCVRLLAKLALEL